MCTACNIEASKKFSNELGILYVAFGAPYLSMALVSARSARATNPHIPLCIVTDVCQAPPDISWWENDSDYWRYISSDHFDNGYAPKTEMNKLTPFTKTLFIDCDTIVLGDISAAEHLLVYFDILLRPTDSPGQDSKKVILNGSLRYDSVGHFNSGVMGFSNSPRSQDLFELWRRSYRGLKAKRDQPSLLEAIYLSDAKVLHSSRAMERRTKLCRQ